MICVEAVLLVCMLVVYSINFEELNTWSCNVLELLLLSFIALCFCYIDSSLKSWHEVSSGYRSTLSSFQNTK